MKKILFLFAVLATAINAAARNFEVGGNPNPTADREPIEAVDLGLSVKWATCNLGASRPEEYGNYYAWGETEPKSTYTWVNYMATSGGQMTGFGDCGTSKDPLHKFVYPNQKCIAVTEYDAVNVKLGGKWRMPTAEEIKELKDNTTTEWTTINGVYGRKLTSKKNGESIFLPAAGFRYGDQLYSEGLGGYYWSANPNTGVADDAYGLYFGSESIGSWEISGRSYGLPLRPVMEKKGGGSNLTDFSSGAVDLGLSVKWASCNLGASRPEDSGDYYAWGETETKSEYKESNSKWYKVKSKRLKSQGVIDAKGNLTAEYDAANVKLGGKWRMPTAKEIKELEENTTSKYTTLNGVKGFKVTSKKNGNSIFLPDAGYRFLGRIKSEGETGRYWSATAGSKAKNAFHLWFYSFSLYCDNKYISRGQGYTIRPVLED